MPSSPFSTNFKLSARGRFAFSCVLALALIASTGATGAAKSTAIVTILQGSATVIRAVAAFSAIEGVRLLPDDLLRTDKDSLLRIEYEDGTWIELGPESRLELGHPADRRAKAPALYLLSGWMKIGCAAGDTGAKRSIGSTGMDLSDISGTFIIRTVDSTHMIFAEQGAARWIDRAPHAASTVALIRGDFLIAGKTQPPEVRKRPSPDFVSALPIPFRDSLPVRYPLFAGRNVAIKDQHPFDYADVEQWLDAEPSIRRQFIPWWRRKAAQDEAFRVSLERNLSLHPEWDPVLHPEKYDSDGSPVRTTD